MDANPSSVGMISVMGRAHPVRQLYSSKPHRDYLAALIETVVHIHRAEPAGDILAFLTGQVPPSPHHAVFSVLQEEVETAVEMISEQIGSSSPATVSALLAAVCLPKC